VLDLRRLRLLYELHERGTIAAVADALQFTPSAVSQPTSTRSLRVAAYAMAISSSTGSPLVPSKRMSRPSAIVR